MHLWKGDKKFGQGPPAPHVNKIHKNSNFFFRETFPNHLDFLKIAIVKNEGDIF